MSSSAPTRLDSDCFVSLLEKLIGETKFLQNKPPELVPEEDRAGQHVLDRLLPLSEAHGGPLKVRQVHYAPKRGNIIVEYPGSGEGVVSFVGSHLDGADPRDCVAARFAHRAAAAARAVVHANPDEWERDPFKLIREGDKLWGRGTTDCLGHVARASLSPHPRPQ